MRVLLSTYGTRGDVEPVVGLAVRLRALGAQVRVCAPPDFTELLAAADLPLVPIGWPSRSTLHGAPPKRAARPRLAAELIALQYEQILAAAQGCDALVAAGWLPSAASSVAEKLGIPYLNATYCPLTLPSPHHPPIPSPVRPFPPDVTDNQALWELHAQNQNALFGEAIDTHRATVGLPPVGDVRHHVLTDKPWLAADPVLAPWPGSPDLQVTQTGSWVLPDERPLPAGVAAFLDAGAPPVYVGFGSMRAPEDAARVAVEAIRAQGRRVVIGHGWAELALVDDRDDCLAVGEVNHHALFARCAAVVHHGGAGTTTTAARAGTPQVVVPQLVDQPYWASRVAELGIGVAHDGAIPTFESLSAALGTALAAETRVAAGAVAGSLRTDGADVAARLVLETAGRQRPLANADS